MINSFRTKSKQQQQQQQQQQQIPQALIIFSPTANCGKADISGSRVVSGKDASLGEWPWQAWLQQENGKQLCGGSLITPEWVMTAAHCVLFKDKSKYHVILGDVDFKKHEGTEQRFAVKRIVKHPLFSKPVPYQNDVALFQLSHPVRLTPFVKTACLPESFEEVPPGTTCFISGACVTCV